MIDRYMSIPVRAIRDTPEAFCCTFTIDDVEYVDMWLPLSVLHESCHQDIELATHGDDIEIHVAKWFYNKRILER